ncbi:hypothetical protein GCM10010923_20720 [Blastomonas marina]|uniref:TonB C-terminal domain-containing protein n=2 Tax=Blastomonas marina TaxID=1867408 RepID=A0ABQ1FF53_9SPHN|nr:hypothetical protein GCM10010923_20720 [Blastomonas marina]
MPFGGGNLLVDVEANLTDSQLGTLLVSAGRYTARWTETRVEGSSVNNSRSVTYQRTAQIDLSPVFATLKALRACQAKAPPATQAKSGTVAKRPEENRKAQLRSSIYNLFLYEGGRLLRAGITQVPPMTIAVDVNVDGRPKECRVVKSGGSATVDEGVCRIFSRASYSPATDRAAKPIASTLTIEVPSIRLAE